MKHNSRHHDLAKTLLICFALLLGSARLLGVEPVNSTCPVTPGEPIDPTITTTYKGRTIALCCKSCLRKFNRDPEAYLAELNASESDFGQAEDTPSATSDPHLGHNEGPDHDHGSKKHSSDAESTSDAEVGHPAHAAGPFDFHNEESHASGDHADEPSGTHQHDTFETTGPSLSLATDAPHDHATDHGSTEGNPSMVAHAAQYLGRFHVLAVHLPIAFLPFAALFELLGWIRHRDRLTSLGRVLFVIGVTGAIVAASLGWLAAEGANYRGELVAYLDWHRWAGTVSALFGLLGLLALWAPRLGMPWGVGVYRVSVFILGIFIPLTAHLGGSLIYGADYLF